MAVTSGTGVVTAGAGVVPGGSDYCGDIIVRELLLSLTLQRQEAPPFTAGQLTQTRVPGAQLADAVRLLQR